MENEEYKGILKGLYDKIDDQTKGQVAGISTEVAAGLALDAKTQGLLGLGPWGWLGYGVTNFIGGAGANIAAQKMRGEENIKPGEVISSGLLGVIPGTSLRFAKPITKVVGEANTVKRAATFGATQGLTDQVIQKGIDEKRLPTPSEAALGLGVGGVIGGTLKSAQLDPDESGKLLVMWGKVDPDSVSPYMKSKVKLHKRALDDEMLHWDTKAVERRSKIDEQFELDSSGKPKGPRKVFASNTEAARRAKAAWSLGEEVSPADIKIFEESNQSILDGYNWYLHGSNIKVGKTEGHHKGVVRQIFDASNGLNRKYRLKSAKYMEKRIGFELGYHGRNAEPVPIRFHPRVHAIINARISSSPDRFNVEGAAKRLGFPENWQSVLTYEERLPLYNEVADAIRESVDAINTSWKVLLSRSDDLTAMPKEEYLELMLNHRKLDDKLKKVASPHLMAQTTKTGWGLKETSTTVLNDILTKSGRQDLTLPVFIRQVEADMPPGLKKVIRDKNAWQILKEMVISGKSSTVVMKAHPAIKMTVKQRNSLDAYARTLRSRGSSLKFIDEIGMRAED